MAKPTPIKIPELGDFADVPVVEILVAPGDQISPETPLLTLESDKATMEVPSPVAGTVADIVVKVGDIVSTGSVIMHAKVVDGKASAEAEPASESEPAPEPAPEPELERELEPKLEPASEAKLESELESEPAPAAAEAPPIPEPIDQPLPEPARPTGDGPLPHASPGVRRFARELGADLSQIQGSGKHGRILQGDVSAWVKQRLGQGGAAGGAMPVIDFSRFGKTSEQPLGRIKQISGPHLHRAWQAIPHVTHHEHADITDLEAFRRDTQARTEGRISLLAFVIKALVAAMREYPIFNASLAPDGKALILKHYFNIGIAVDTPNGLVVPVLRAVEHKGVLELAAELGAVSARAREGKLGPADLEGGCITISSLGGIGGSSFAPIINAPEVAILGLSRARMQPVWDGEVFEPRLMLPLSLSYDHRVIDGAEGARFAAKLAGDLSDPRNLLL